MLGIIHLFPQSASDTPHTCSQHCPRASISLSVDEHWKCPNYQSEYNIWRFKAERDLRAKAKGCNSLFWKIEIKVIKYQKPEEWFFIPIHITFFLPPPSPGLFLIGLKCDHFLYQKIITYCWLNNTSRLTSWTSTVHGDWKGNLIGDFERSLKGELQVGLQGRP